MPNDPISVDGRNGCGLSKGANGEGDEVRIDMSGNGDGGVECRVTIKEPTSNTTITDGATITHDNHIPIDSILNEPSDALVAVHDSSSSSSADRPARGMTAAQKRLWAAQKQAEYESSKTGGAVYSVSSGSIQNPSSAVTVAGPSSFSWLTFATSSPSYDPLHPRIGMAVDAKDCGQDWRKGVIVDVTDRKFRVAYKGWSDRWDEWYPIGTDRVVEANSRTRLTYDTGPSTSNPTPLNGHRFDMFAEYVTGKWSALWHKVEKAIKEVETVEAVTSSHGESGGSAGSAIPGLPSPSVGISAFVCNVLDADDWKLLMKENYDNLNLVLGAFIENPFHVPLVHDYLKQNLQLLTHILTVKRMGEMRPTLFECLLKLLDCWKLSEMAAGDNVADLVENFENRERKEQLQSDGYHSSSSSSAAQLHDHSFHILSVLQQQQRRQPFFQHHGVGPVETANDDDAVAETDAQSSTQQNTQAGQTVKTVPPSADNSSPSSSSTAAPPSHTVFAERPPPPPRGNSYKQTHQISQYLIDFINLFARMGGLELIRRRMEESFQSDTNRGSGPYAFQNFTASMQLMLAISRFLTPQWRERIIPALRLHELMPARVETLSEEEIKFTSRDVMHASIVYSLMLVGLYYHTLSHRSTEQPTTANGNAHEPAAATSSSRAPVIESCGDWCLNVALTLYLRLIHSDVLERQINGITDMSELVRAIRKAEGGDGDGDDVSRVSARRISTFTRHWLLAHCVLSSVVEKSSHEEILRRSSPILSFLLHHHSLNFDQSIIGLWNATTGKHENYARVVCEIMTDMVEELNIDEIHRLYEHVTAGICMTKHAVLHPPASHHSTHRLSFAISDYYLTFLKTFTVRAIKRTLHLWRQRQKNMPVATEWEQQQQQQVHDGDDQSLNTSPIYAVQTFIDMLHQSVAAAANSASDHSNSHSATPLLSYDLQSLILTQLLPECLATFPLQPLRVDPDDDDSTILIESEFTLTSRLISDCITHLQQAPYHPTSCVMHLQIMHAILSFFPIESVRHSFQLSVSPQGSCKRSEIIAAVVRAKVQPMELCLHIVREQCRFFTAYKLQCPSSVQTNGDILLPGDVTHSSVLHYIFDFFFTLLHSDPHADMSEDLVCELWKLMVGPATQHPSSNTEPSPTQTQHHHGEGVDASRVTPHDAAIFFYFFYRLLDADAQSFHRYHTTLNASAGFVPVSSLINYRHPAPSSSSYLSSSSSSSSSLKPNGTSNTSYAGQKTRNQIFPSVSDNDSDGERRVGQLHEEDTDADDDDDDGVPPGSLLDDFTPPAMPDGPPAHQAHQPSNDSSTHMLGWSIDPVGDRHDIDKLEDKQCNSAVEPLASVDEMDSHDDEAMKRLSIPDTHFLPPTTRTLLIHLLHSDIFCLLPVSLKQLGNACGTAAQTLHTTCPSASLGSGQMLTVSSPTSTDSIQFHLLHRLFFLANQYCGRCSPMQFAPYVKLEVYDGRLVGMKEVWDWCTAGPTEPAAESSVHALASSSTSSPQSSSSSTHPHPSLLRELRSFLVDLYSKKYVQGGMYSSSSSSNQRTGDMTRNLAMQCLRTIWSKMEQCMEKMRREAERRHENQQQGQVSAVRQLQLLLELLHELLDHDDRAFSAFSPLSSNSSPFVIRSSPTSSNSTRCSVTSLLAEHYFDDLYKLLQTFTTPSECSSLGLDSHHPLHATLTEQLFKLLMRLPAHSTGAQTQFVKRITGFEFSGTSENAGPDHPAWDELFSSSSMVSLLFSLQIILDYFARPSGNDHEKMAHDIMVESWQSYFMTKGGLKHILQIFTNVDLAKLHLTPDTIVPNTTADDGGAETSNNTISRSASSADVVLSRRCLSLLLQFISKFLCEAANWEKAYLTDDETRFVTDLNKFAQQLQTIVLAILAASPYYTTEGRAESNASKKGKRIAAARRAALRLSSPTMGLLTPSPSPSPSPSPPPDVGTPPSSTPVLSFTDEDHSLLMNSLGLLNSMLVGACDLFIRAAHPLPPIDKRGHVTGQLHVSFDPTLLSTTFWRTLMLDGLVRQRHTGVRTGIMQSQEQLMDAWRQMCSAHPVQLHWYFMQLCMEIMMNDASGSVDWMQPYDRLHHGGFKDLMDFTLALLQWEDEEIQKDRRKSGKRPYPFYAIVHTDSPFDPYAFASHMTDCILRRPTFENMEACGRVLSPDNVEHDPMLDFACRIAQFCIMLIQNHSNSWRAKIHSADTRILHLVEPDLVQQLDNQTKADNIIRALFDALYELPEQLPSTSPASTPAIDTAIITHPSPKCKSYQCRKSCSRLLGTCADSHHRNLTELISYLDQFQRSYIHDYERPNVKEWEYKLPNESGTAGSALVSAFSNIPYIGIKNLGNTCYINALMQQLFMIPDLRRNILRIDLPPSQLPFGDPNQSVVIQLQSILSTLLYSSSVSLSKPTATTESFCKAFKDWDGQPINPAIQEDSGLFFTRLVDKVQEELKGTPYANVIQQTLCGKVANRLHGTDPAECSHAKQSYEDFSTLQLEIKNKKTLEQSLAAYVEGELLSGSNAYRCSLCNRKVSTLKRTVISHLPKTLCLVLKRFEMDYTTMTTHKINDQLTFTTRLNMKPYTLEAMTNKQQNSSGSGNDKASASAAEQTGKRDDSKESDEKGEVDANAGASTSSSTPSVAQHPDDYYEYVLRGVVVHSGTVGGGHYYSYIQDRSAPADTAEGWFEMNDTKVSKFTFSRLADECFGGPEHGGWSTSNKSRNAYILFYERVRKPLTIDPSKQPSHLSFSAAAGCIQFCVRIRNKYRRTLERLIPSSHSQTSQQLASSQLALQTAAHEQALAMCKDFIAYHPTTLEFHLSLANISLYFLIPQTAYAFHCDLDLMSVWQYLWRWFMHIYLRSFSHNHKLKEWMEIMKKPFTFLRLMDEDEEEEDEEKKQAYLERVMKMATWTLRWMIHQPKSSNPTPQADDGKAASHIAAPQSSGKSGAKDDSSSRSSLTSTTASSSSSSSSRSRASHKRARSDDGYSCTWAEVGGDDDVVPFNVENLPPLDAPASLLFQYLIACPEKDVRDAILDIVHCIAVFVIEHRPRKQLPLVITQLIDHLVTFVPYLPFYAGKSLVLYLRLLFRLCKASDEVVRRLLMPTLDDGVRNDLPARLLDLYLGGVSKDENPCGNTINGMPRSARGRRYYPLPKDTVHKVMQWRRPFWALLARLITHADTSTIEKGAADAQPTPAEVDSSSTADAQSSSSPASVHPLTPQDGESFTTLPSIPLSSSCVQLLRFPPLLDQIIHEAFNPSRLNSTCRLLTTLCRDHLEYSKIVIQAIFHALTENDAAPVYYTLLRQLLNIKDSVAMERVHALMHAWLRFLEDEQVYYRPVDSSLDYLLAILQMNDDAIAFMHQHISKWQWLIDWCLTNKVPPGFDSESGIQLDKQRRGMRSRHFQKSMVVGGDTLHDEWNYNSSLTSSSSVSNSYARPPWMSNLSSFSDRAHAMNAALSLDEAVPLDDVSEDENEDENENDDGSDTSTADESTTMHQAARSTKVNGQRAPARLKLFKAKPLSMKTKYRMFRRVRNGKAAVPHEGEKDTEGETESVEMIGWDESAPSHAISASSGSSSGSSSSRTYGRSAAIHPSSSPPPRGGSLPIAPQHRNEISSRMQWARRAGGSASGDEEEEDEEDEDEDEDDAAAIADVEGGRQKRGVVDSTIQWRMDEPVDALKKSVDQPRRWQAARIIAMEDERVKVHFDETLSADDEWIAKSSQRIAPRGTRTQLSLSPYHHSPY